MRTMPYRGAGVVVGVDTHKDVHVAVVVDATGRRLGARSFPVSRAGYAALLAWARGFGRIGCVGIEGTGSWGRGLTVACLAAGVEVRDVDRPDRAARRHHGKTDLVDADAAARAVLAGTATTVPKSGDGPVEMLRVLHITRETAVRARTAAINQLRSLVATAPLELADDLRGLRLHQLLATAASFPAHGPLTTPTDATRRALRALARRIDHLDREITELTIHRDQLVAATAPDLLAARGVGPHAAAALLIAAGDNPDRLGTEAAFARLCATAPIPVASGRSHRHRLHHGGNRQANRALHTVVVSRLRWPDDRTRAYVVRHNPTRGGKADLDTIRRLKRHLVRELYPLILRALTTPQPAPNPS